MKRKSSQPVNNVPITNSSKDRVNKQVNVGNLPCPEIHRSKKTQGSMAGVRTGHNLEKTVGECEIEVGRLEMRQCVSVLLEGTEATVPQWCPLLLVESCYSRSSVLVLSLA